MAVADSVKPFAHLDCQLILEWGVQIPPPPQSFLGGEEVPLPPKAQLLLQKSFGTLLLPRECIPGFLMHCILHASTSSFLGGKFPQSLRRCTR